MLGHLAPGYKAYSFLERGSNERQLCAPGIDLPVTSVMRSRYGCYAEYHTSLDDLSLVTPAGLAGGFMALRRAIECLELDERCEVTVLGEPQLGKRGLYPDLSTRYSGWQVREMMNLLAYSDGKLTLFEIAETIGAPFWRVEPLARMLLEAGLLRRLSPQPDYSITR
ncbi:aminopeptidase [Aeromonas hydrophila]|nr:aminopeptidase [Aeromonas hydrophila]